MDTLTGDDDVNNVIEGGDLGDTLVGGSGTGDTVSYASSDDRVRVELADDGGVFNPTKGHARGDTVSEFENVTGSASMTNWRVTILLTCSRAAPAMTS